MTTLTCNKPSKTKSAWERVDISRHPQRPHSIDYVQNIASDFLEIFGDRSFRDDPSIITGLGTIGGQKFMIVAQEKGNDTESRIRRNFGSPHPEGYRKALRAIQLAEKFGLPILCLLDTPGAYAGLPAEERGQGWAIAKNLYEMSRIKTPILVLVIGEGCSGGAIGIGVGDVIGMLENSYYSVIAPEGCSSILWKDTGKKQVAAEALKMHAEDLIQFGIVDVVLPEPPGGAHTDPDAVFQEAKEFAVREASRLLALPETTLVENRYQKFREMGKFERKSNLRHETPSCCSHSK